MKKEIILNEDKSEVTIHLCLLKRHMARDPRMTITTKMVQRMLQNENFKVDKCIINDIINNDNANSKHEGKWIFSLLREKPLIKEVTVEESKPVKPLVSKPLISKKPRKKKES